MFRMRELGVRPKERRILGGNCGNRGRVAGVGGDLRGVKSLIRKMLFPYQSHSARPRPAGIDRPGGPAPVAVASSSSIGSSVQYDGLVSTSGRYLAILRSWQSSQV